jgi:transcriptional regulator with XRE-family HTH domain
MEAHVVARWRPLPGTLDPASRLLAEQLRTLKEQTGLSLDGLARRTPYSRSAWHRYLNGEKPPPRGCIESLSAVAGEDPEPLLELYADAQLARTATLPEPTADSGNAQLPVHAGRMRRTLGVAGMLMVLTAPLGAAAFAHLPAHAERAQREDLNSHPSHYDVRVGRDGHGALGCGWSRHAPHPE